MRISYVPTPVSGLDISIDTSWLPPFQIVFNVNPLPFCQYLGQTTGEGNGTPLQYSCLENPMDRGAWWAAICGVAQSRIRLKLLSSSSSRLDYIRLGEFTFDVTQVQIQILRTVTFTFYVYNSYTCPSNVQLDS